MTYNQDLPPNEVLETHHTVHRSASRGFSRTPDHLENHGRLTIGIGIIAAVSFAGMIVLAVMFFMYKSTATTEIRQLQLTNSTQQAALVQDQSSNANGYNSLSGKLGSMQAALSVLAPYSQICVQDFTGPNGPAQYYIPCTDQKPAGLP